MATAKSIDAATLLLKLRLTTAIDSNQANALHEVAF